MYKLFPHNQFAFDRLISLLEINDKACIVQPTGTGKSYITAELLKTYPELHFLIITSNTYILEQFNSSFQSFFDNYTFITYPFLISSQFESLKKLKFDYIILDEFHRAGATLWGEKVYELLSLHNGKTVGLTATDVRYLEEDRDMIEELFDGNLAHKISLLECFDLGILPRPKYISTIYNIDIEFDRLYKSFKSSKFNNNAQLKKRIIEYKAKWEYSNGASIILKKYITKERNFLIFSTDTIHLEQMVHVVKNWFKIFNLPINVYKVHSNYSESHEDFMSFKEKATSKDNVFNLLFSVQQLNEGLHTPNTDGVIFLRPTDSHIIYYQQLGRCLETKGNQPIVFDMVNNFKKSTIHHDFTETKYIKSFPEGYLKNEYDKFQFSFNVIDEVKDIENVFKDIEFNFSDWNHQYEIFKEKLTNSFTYADLAYKYKKWLKHQKYLLTINEEQNNFEKYQLRIQKIDSLLPMLGFDWKADNWDNVSWERQYNELINALNVTKTYNKIETISKQWLSRQKYEYNNSNSVNTLWAERIEKLDKLIPLIGFDWKTQNMSEIAWQKKFNAFEEAIKKYKSYFNLPSKQKKFLTTQRNDHNSSETWKGRAVMLNSLNTLLKFDWKIGPEQNASWKNEFAIVEKDIIKKKNYSLLNKPSQAFLRKNRHHYKKARTMGLWVERIPLLDSLNQHLGFDWKEGKNPNYIFDKKFDAFKAELLKVQSYKKLSLEHKTFIRGHIKSTLNSNTKSALYKRKRLDSLNTLLGFDWKTPKNNKQSLIKR